MIKPILRVSVASLWYRKRTTLFTLAGIFLAVVLIVVTAVFSVALLDLMLNMTFFDMGTPVDAVPTAADIAQIKDGDDSYTMMFVIVSLLMVLAVLAAVSSISSVLMTNASNPSSGNSTLLPRPKRMVRAPHSSAKACSKISCSPFLGNAIRRAAPPMRNEQ